MTPIAGTLVLSLAVAAALAALPAEARRHGGATPFHRCVNAALKQKPGTVIQVEQETKDGNPVYEIDIASKDGTKWELTCDLATMKIVKVEQEDYDEKDEKKPATSAASAPSAPVFKITEQQAREIALKQYGGEVTRVMYEYDDGGRSIYEVHIRSPRGTRIEVEVDGRSGEVLEISEKPR